MKQLAGNTRSPHVKEQGTETENADNPEEVEKKHIIPDTGNHTVIPQHVSLFVSHNHVDRSRQTVTGYD